MMSSAWPDVTNSIFLTSGGLLIWLNVVRAFRDKNILGVSPWPAVWFALWGFWDCYYFPHLGQWWSFVGSVSAALPNITWVCLYVYYKKYQSVPA